MGHTVWLTNKGELGFKPIIQNHKSFATDEMRNRNFEEHVLAYVTPWNNHGYVRDQNHPLPKLEISTNFYPVIFRKIDPKNFDSEIRRGKNVSQIHLGCTRLVSNGSR